MKYVIDTKVLYKQNVPTSELLITLLVKTGANINNLITKMLEEKKLVQDLLGNYLVSQGWDDTVCKALLDGDTEKEEGYYNKLASQLMEIFPKQKKQGTCHYFRGNLKDNSLKLKKFFKLYGNKYTEEQILNAARQYVASFNGNYQYMRILKYFIWKDERKIDSDGNGYIEESSDLATYIDNCNSNETLNNDWASEVL